MEELQLNEDDILAFYRFLNHEKYSHFQVFMLDKNNKHEPVTSNKSYPSKSYFINNEKMLLKGCTHFKDKGLICLGINEREKDQTKIEDGISKINLILFDIDVNEEVRIKGRAPVEYIKEAMKVGEDIEKRLNELGFSVDYTCFSGNGFHGGIKVNIDLPTFGSKKEWKESDFHKRLVALENEMKKFETKNVTIDTISKDIARRVKIPGTYNIKRYKIGDHQFESPPPSEWVPTKITYLNKNPNEQKNNDAFFNIIIPEEEIGWFKTEQKAPPKELAYYLKKDQKLKRLMNGEHLTYKSRSEAEQALVTKLVFYGFKTRSQIDPIMNECQIGKWSEKPEEYKDLTLENAINFNEKNVPSRKELYDIYEKTQKARAIWQGFETKNFKKWVEDYLSDEDDDRELYIRIVNRCKERFSVITLKQSRTIMIGNGFYYTSDISELEDFIARQLEETNVKNYRTKKGDVFELLMDTTKFDEEQFYFEDNLVPFLNGYYNVQEEVFYQYDDLLEKPFFYVIPHEFKQDKKYDCPLFKKKLKEWVVNPNSKVRVDDMFEAFGYTLTPTTSYKYFFVNYGVPHTAKSQLMNILDHVVGPRNSISTSPNQFKGRFELGFLQWKLVAKSPDMSKEALFDNAVIKNLTGGDRGARGEIKGGKLFNLIPTIKLWFNVNELPEIEDLRDIAFFDRVMLFLYEKVYSSKLEGFERDYYLEIVKDEDEMQGILHESLKGMKRLQERKCLREELVKNNRHRWLSLSNDPYNFIHEACQFGKDCRVKRDILWNKYVEEYGEAYGKVKFYQTLYQLGYPARQVYDNDSKKPFWYIIGLEIKNEGTSYESLDLDLNLEIPEEYK